MIYTKKGDTGTTTLFGGKKVSKDNPVIEAIGTIDELTSFLGHLTHKVGKDDKDVIVGAQKDLYLIMASLSGAETDLESVNNSVKKIEQYIDKILSNRLQLNRFILPGQAPVITLSHIVRSICRRAERRIVAAKKEIKPEVFSLSVKYLNRLSDFLYALTRKYEKKDKTVLV